MTSCVDEPKAHTIVRRFLIFLVAGFALPTAAPGQESVSSDPAGLRQLTTETPARDCSSTIPSGEIVVCGSRNRERYRLPPGLRGETEHTGGDIRPRLPYDANGLAPCGIFQGERVCGKREAAQYGWTPGRDPITFVVKVVGKIVDSER